MPCSSLRLGYWKQEIGLECVTVLPVFFGAEPIVWCVWALTPADLGVPCSLLNRASVFLVGNQKFLHYQFSDTKYITDFLFHSGFLVQYLWLFNSLCWFLKHEFSCTSEAPTFLVLSITDWYRELWRLFCSGSDTQLLTFQQIDLSSQCACN